MTLLSTWIFARIRLTSRNPRAVVFTLAFPLILIVLFSALNGNTEVQTYGTTIRFAQFYTPAIAVMSLVTACYTTIVMGLAAARDEGLLKRVRGTPLPMWMYLSAWVTAAVAVGIGAVAVLFAVSVPAFGLHIYADSLLPAIVTLLLGAACLSALGVAVATLVKSVDQAQPVVQLTFLPLSLHLRHLVPARRRAGLARLGRRGVPALPPRPGVRQRVHARTAGGSRSTSRCWRSGRSARC